MTALFVQRLRCLGVALALPFGLAAAAVPVVTTVIPTDLSACEQATFTITVVNTAAQPQAAGTLQYCLPEGLVFAAATVLTPADLSDSRCPVLNLPAIPADGSLSFELSVQVGCFSIDRGDVRDTIRLTLGGVPQPPVLGSAYNLRTPVVTLLPRTNWSYTGAIGEEFTRTFTVRNEGLGAAFLVFVVDPFAQAGLELVQTTGTFQGDTLLLTGTDLGPNGYLGYLDSVVVTQTFRITGCGTQAVVIEYGWGCPDGTTCGLLRYEQYIASGGFSPQPSVQVSLANPFPRPRPCEPEIVEIRIANAGTAPALGLEWLHGLTYSSGDPGSSASKWECYQMTDFRVGGAVLPDLSFGAIPDPYRMVFSGLLSDPDGPGGLSDEDGDGQFDDLAPGAETTVQFVFELNPACKQCNETQSLRFVAAQFRYGSSCYDDIFSDLPANGEIGIHFDDNDFEIEQDFIFDAGQTYDFSYTIHAPFGGLQAQCPNDSIVAEFLLPVTLGLPPGFQPLFDSVPVPWWSPNDSTVYLLLPGTVGNLDVPLLAICPPDIDDSAPCTPPYEPRVYQLPVNIRWRCGNGCPEEYALVCMGGIPFTVDCPRPDDTSQQHGVFADTFFVRRLSVGYVDNVLSAQVDPTLDSLRLDRGIPYDTVLMQASARFEGTPGEVFDSMQIQVYYWNGLGEYFLPLGAAVVLEDAETGAEVLCPGLSFDYRYVDGYHIWEADLLPLTQPGGCLFNSGVQPTPGDRLHLEVTARLTEALPYLEVEQIKDLRVRFPYVYHGDSLLCETQNAFFEAINPLYEISVFPFFENGVCDALSVDVVLHQGLSGRIQSDLFPHEIRPLFTYDTLVVELQPGYVYLPGSATWLYRLGDGANAPPLPPPVLLPMADPQLALLPNGNTALLFTRPPGLPVTDYYQGLAPTILSFRAEVLCPPDTTLLPVHLVGRSLFSVRDTVDVQYTGTTRLFEDLNETGLFTFAPASGNRVPRWVVEYCNPGPGIAIAEPQIFVENGPGLLLLSADDVTDPFAPMPLAFAQTAPDLAVVTGLPLDVGVCRSIELRATVLECANDTLRLTPGFQCPNAAAPCLLANGVDLYFLPKDALPQVGVTAGPTGTANLCEPVDYELRIVNVGEGGMYDIELLIQLPLAGQTLVPGSWVVEYDGTSVPLPDPLPTPEGLRLQLDFSQLPFALEALPGVFFAPANTLVFHFQLETNCDYVDGTRFRYAAAWRDACGGTENTARFVAPPLQIEGAPTATNAYQIAWQMPNPASYCGENAVRLSIVNPGDLGPTMANEKVRAVLPPGFVYVPGSLQPLHNGPVAPPVVLPFGDAVFLTFGLPANVAAGDSMVFEFQIQNNAASTACSAAYPFGVQMLQTANVACGNTGCDIDFVLLEETFFALFEKPVFALSGLAGTAIPANADLEQWAFDFQVNNLSSVPGGGALQIEVRLDGNQNADLDPADPLLVAFAANVEGLLPGAAQTVSQTANVAAASGCSGLWVVLTDTLCACARDSVYIPFVPLANSGQDRTACAGETIALGFVPLTGANYAWLPASPNLSSSSAPDPTYRYAGPFDPSLQFAETLVLQTTRAQGCTSFDTVRITTRRVEVTLAANAVLCWGDSTGAVQATVQGAEVPVQFFWNTGSSSDEQLSNLPAGNYALTVVDALGCADTAAVLVSQPDALTLALAVSNFNGFGLSCFGANDGSIGATASGGAGGYQYAWLPTGAGPSLANLPPGAYALTLTDANGCTSEADALLAEPPPLVLTLTVQDEICLAAANGSIAANLLGGAPPYTVNGQPASGATAVLSGLSAGAFTVLVADANGCTAEADTSLTVLFSEVAVSADSATCFGGNNGQAAATATGFPPFVYAWSNGPTQPGISAPAGTYTVTVTDALGCTYSLAAVIGQPPLLTGTAAVQDVGCFGDSTGRATLTAQGGTPPYQFDLNGQPVASPVANMPAGPYTFVLTDANGCTAVLPATVQQPAPLDVLLTAMDAPCFGSSTGSVGAAPSGGTLPYLFAWSNGAAATALDAVAAGTYALTLTDGNGCTAVDTALVDEPAPYEPDFAVLRLPCADRANGLLAATGFPTGTRFGLNRPPDRDTALFDGVGGGPVVLFVEDPVGCLFEFDFEMPALPEMLGTLLTDTTIRLGDSAWLRVEPAPGVPVDDLRIEWLNPLAPLSDCDTCPALWVRPFRSANYVVRLTTASGCQTESRVRVQVVRDSVYAPNALHPDAALDENRYFTLYARPGLVREIRLLRVFDRWGDAVFERRAFAPNDHLLGWDGRYRGQIMQPGVFVWYAEVEYADGVVERLEGDVTVVR